MVPGEPPRTCGRTAANPQRQTPGPLPILRTTDELQEHLEVLSGGLPHLAKVAQSPNSWEEANVGEIYRTPPPPSFVASLDHTSLELYGESHLRNPLRGNLHGGVCEGGELGAATVDLNGHEAGNGGYSQGRPTAHWVLLYSERFPVTPNRPSGFSYFPVTVIRSYQGPSRRLADDILAIPRQASRSSSIPPL